MAILVVRSKVGQSRRRSGTLFPHNRFLAIDTDDYDDDGAAIIADAKLEKRTITDTEDADLLDSIDVINPEIIPEPEE